MNELIKSGTALTMSSREIAELTGKEHKNVLADIRKMLDDLGQTSAEFSASVPDAYGRHQVVFNLPKRETLILVSGYSVALRAKIIDRWQALENGTAALPKSLPEALRLAADLADQKAKAEAALAVAAPKADALDRLAKSDGNAVCLRVAAKLLQVPEKQFLQFAQQENFIFRHHHSRVWQGYSDKEKSGWLELKLTEVTRDDGSTKTVEQVLITRAGLAKLAERIEKKAPWLKKAESKPMMPPASSGTLQYSTRAI